MELSGWSSLGWSSPGGIVQVGIVRVELSGWNCPGLVWSGTILSGIVWEEQSWGELFGWNSPGWNSGVELSRVEMSWNRSLCTVRAFSQLLQFHFSVGPGSAAIFGQKCVTQPFKVQKVQKAEKYDGVVTTHSFHGSVELSYKFLVLPPLI